MPAWFPRSTCGVVLVVLYVAVAMFIVAADRKPHNGSWISLNGILSFLVTFPVSALGERWGMRPDYRKNLDMAFAISACAVLVYFVGAGLGALAKLLFSS
jgi:hypothetical protein